MSITDELLKKVFLFLKENGISGSDRIQIGFSGGPDSTVLFHLLKTLIPDFGYSLYALYVDHGIRPEKKIKKEIDNVREIARKIGGDLEIEHIPHGKIEKVSVDEGRSIEEIAREFRYVLFRRKEQERKATLTALGHNLDDNVETLLMRVFQGSGIYGLTGIHPRRDDVIRPLIDTTRYDIEIYAAENGLKPVLDETNLDSVYLRNRIRNELLPVAEKIFPGYRTALLTMGKKITAAAEYASENTAGILEKTEEDGSLNVSIEEFRSLTSFERMELLYKSWDKWIDKPHDKLSFRAISGIMEGKKIPSGKILFSGPDYSLICRGGMIFWNRLVVSRKKSYLRVITSGNYMIPGAVKIEVVSDERISEEFIWLDSGKINGPLVVRSRKPGDYIDLAGGRKALKKLFVEWKVPEDDRWKIPVVADRSGIAAVLGKPFGYKNRISAKHRVPAESKPDKTLMLKAYME